MLAPRLEDVRPRRGGQSSSSSTRRRTAHEARHRRHPRVLHMLEKYGQDGDRARDFNDEWGGLHFKRSFPYVVDDRVKVAYYLKKSNPNRISQSNPWRNWAKDKDADGWIKGCITEVDYFGGVYVAFDEPAKKRKQKNSPQRTLEDQYLSHGTSSGPQEKTPSFDDCDNNGTIAMKKRRDLNGNGMTGSRRKWAATKWNNKTMTAITTSTKMGTFSTIEEREGVD